MRSCTGIYERLLHALRDERILEGEWRLCPPADDESRAQEEPLLAWGWQRLERRYLIVINYAGTAYQGQIRTPWIDLAGRTWQVHDLLSGQGFKRSGDKLNDKGIWVDLPSWGLPAIVNFPGRGVKILATNHNRFWYN